MAFKSQRSTPLTSSSRGLAAKTKLTRKSSKAQLINAFKARQAISK